MRGEPFDASLSLAQLKHFQRRTVDYVFDRLHGSDQVRQFLVADEVGLGKTMIARGIVAKTIEMLWPKAKRIDIVYICSNQSIAAQNLNRTDFLTSAAPTSRSSTAWPALLSSLPWNGSPSMSVRPRPLTSLPPPSKVETSTNSILSPFIACTCGSIR